MAQDPALNHARSFLRGELRSEALRKAFELALRLAWISGYGAVRAEQLEELRRQTRAADEQVLLLERQVALLQGQRDQAIAPGPGPS